jgi:hypothetical protein
LNSVNFRVLNLKNDKYIPHKNGQTKPIVNAINVGNINIGKYFFSDAFIVLFTVEAPLLFFFINSLHNRK